MQQQHAINRAREAGAVALGGVKPFFEAVAGTRSPLNHQSSRLHHPFADNPFLGGGNVGSVATPAQQELLARSNANDKTAPAPIRRQATTIAQNYVKGADTEKVIPAHKTAAAPRGGGAGVQGAALTAPNAIAQGQRALGLLGANIPLGSAAPAAIRGLQALGLPDVERQQVIQGFASDPTLAQPGVRAELVARALAQNHSLPAHPTSAQLLTAAISPDQHKGSYWDALNPLNIAKDAIYTPVFSFEGGQALGHATREVLPSGLGGQGDTSGLKAIGESQLKTLEHPGAFIQQHPFQAALAVIGGAKTLGGIGGKLAGTETAARDVTLSHYPLTPINRGELDTNLATRGAQKLSDTILAKGPEQFQSNALKNRVQGASSAIQRERSLSDQKTFNEYAQARKGISRRRQMSLLQNESQALTAPEREAFYNSLGETPARAAQAKLAGAQAEKFPAVTPKEQAFVDAARKVAQNRTQELVGMGKLSNEAALRRDYQPLIHVRASQGDATASSILSTENDLRQWSDSPLPKDPDLRAHREQRIQALSDQHDQLVKQFAAQHLAQGGGIESVTPGRLATLGTNPRFGEYREPTSGDVGDVHDLPAPPELPNATVTRRDFKGRGGINPSGVPYKIPGFDDIRQSYISIHDGQGLGRTDEAAHLNITHTADGALRIDHVYVRPDLRATTLGNTLLDHALAESKGAPIEASFKNERLGKVADRYFRSRGYTKENSGADRVRYIPPAAAPDVVTYRPGAQPFRVPMSKPKVKSEFNTPGQPVRANANIPISGIGKTRSYGDLLRSGNFTQTPEAFNRQLFEPHTTADAQAFVRKVVDPSSGMGAVPVENGQPLSDAVRERYVLRNTDNLRTKPKGADLSVDATDFSNKEADALRTLKDLNEGWVTDPNELQRVPDEGHYVLVPKPVYEQVSQTVRRVTPGSVEARIGQATHAFKTGVLMTRPTYPLTNLANGMIQGLPARVGPLSWARAAAHSIPIPAGVPDAGFVAREFGHAAQQTARGYLDEGRPIRAIRQATIGNYTKTIRDLSIKVDNAAREATYAKVGLKGAKKLAGYNKFQQTFKRANADVNDWLQKMADGETPEARRAAEKAVQTVNDLQGDYAGMRSHPGLDALAPFHRWQRFVTKLMLKTLPLKYPGTTFAAYQLGNLGEQAAGQKGALPQYLADVADVAGGPLNRIGLDFSKTNPAASLGTSFEPDAQGNPDIGQGIISNLTPFASIGYGALTGKDLQSGNALLNGQGKPVTSYADKLRYVGAQAAGFVPPLGALAGGLTGRPATSIPLPGLTQSLPASAKRTKEPTGPTLDLPFIGKEPIIPLLNQIVPLRITDRNETVDQLKGFKAFALHLRQQLQAELKAKAHTQADATRIEAKFAAIDAEAQKRQAYYAANPKALSALLASGTAK